MAAAGPRVLIGSHRVPPASLGHFEPFDALLFSPDIRHSHAATCGYAAMTVVPASASVLTVEYKLNLVAPADGQRLIARGQVVRPGRTLIVTKADVFAINDDKETLCALMQQTIIVM